MIAVRCAEVHDIAQRRPHAPPHQFGEQRSEPRAAGEHIGIAADHLVAIDRDAIQRAVRRRTQRGLAQHDASAEPFDDVGHGLHRATRPHHAGVRLGERDLDVIDVDDGPPIPHFVGRQHLVRNPELRPQLAGARGERFVLRPQDQVARLEEQVQALVPAPLVIPGLPAGHRLTRPAHPQLADGHVAVARSDAAGLVAARRAGVARAQGIDERDPRAASEQFIGGPRAPRARSDDHDVPAVAAEQWWPRGRQDAGNDFGGGSAVAAACRDERRDPEARTLFEEVATIDRSGHRRRVVWHGELGCEGAEGLANIR